MATTNSRHADLIAPNHLPEITLSQPNQVWVTDATGVLTGQGWLYVVALLDVYTRRIVGWAMHEILDARLAVRALEMAIAQRKPGAKLIVHSDRGTQFASAAYRAAPRRAPPRRLDEPEGQLLRQRVHGVVLEQLEI